jgi:hypothetical protein
MLHFLSQAAQSATTPVASLTLDQIDKGVKIVAVILGGIWTYLNYVRGRTFKRRLEPTISGKVVPCGEMAGLFVSGTAQVKNVGLSKVDIEQSGTAIVIDDMIPGASKKGIPKLVKANIPGGVAGVFERHRWIEPGETIEESFAVLLPVRNDRACVRLRLRIVSRHKIFKNIEWNADGIAELACSAAEASSAAGKQPVLGGQHHGGAHR